MSTADRAALAQRHLRALARAQSPTWRQRLRLALLRSWAGRYPAALSPSAIPPQRILVIRPDHLGDLLFATPALHLLRRQFPAAQITALVGPWGEPVLANNRDLDQVLACPFPGFTRQPKDSLLAPYRLLQGQAQRLRPMQFDLALILRFDHWWGAWLAAAAGIARRAGYAVPEVQPFLTQPLAYLPGRHEVVQNLALVLATTDGDVDGEDEGRSAGGALLAGGGRAGDGMAGEGWRLRFEATAADEEAAERLLAPLAGAGRLVAVHPGSGAAVKRWPAENWAALAGELARRYAAQVVFTGSAGEASLIEPILAALSDQHSLSPRPISLAGQTSLGALAALYRRCALVIGPDSGPLHLAVAMGAATVHLYGPVDRRTFGPWGSPRRQRVVASTWACAPCNRLDWPAAALAEHGCLRDIALEQVLAAISDVQEAFLP